MSQEEIVVPKGWELKELNELAKNEKNSIRRGPWGGAILKSDFTNDGYKVYQQKNVIYDDFAYGDYFISKEKFEKLKEFSLETGDIVITYAGTIGKISIVPDSAKPGIMNQNLLKISLNQKRIIPNLLIYFLKTSIFWDQVKSRGSAMIAFPPTKKLLKTKIPLPPFTTQKQIVAKLDHILGELEVKKKEILSLVKQNKGRIDVFEKNWMSYVIDREIENHPQRKEWKLKELNQLNNIISGNAFKSTEFTKSGIPVITISNVGHGLFIDKSEKFLPIEFEKKYSQFLVKSNYILLALTRPFTDNNRLKVCKTSNLKNSLLNQRVAMIVPSDNIDVNFLLNAMQTTSFKKQTTENLSTSLQPNLSSTKLPLMTIPNPPLSTQKEIVKNIKSAEEKFQSQKKQFENIKNNYESKIKYINHIQSSVLDSAFSGKLVQ